MSRSDLKIAVLTGTLTGLVILGLATVGALSLEVFFVVLILGGLSSTLLWAGTLDSLLGAQHVKVRHWDASVLDDRVEEELMSELAVASAQNNRRAVARLRGMLKKVRKMREARDLEIRSKIEGLPPPEPPTAATETESIEEED